MKRNPNFGVWDDPDDVGGTAPASRYGVFPRANLPASLSSHHCPRCGGVVRWETDHAGGTVAVERGVIHVCDPQRALAHIDHRDGSEILGILRQVLNERRMYGEAV